MTPVLSALWKAANSPATHSVFLLSMMFLYPGPCG